MALLDRDSRSALIDRVARGMTTTADAALVERLLPRALASARRTLTDAGVRAMRETWAEWRRAGVAHRRGAFVGRGYATLGAAYGVGTATARDIVRGRSRLASGGPIDD